MDTTSDMSRLSMVGADIGQRTSGKRKGVANERSDKQIGRLCFRTNHDVHNYQSDGKERVMGIKFYDSNGKYWGEYDETRNLFIPSEKTTTQTETQNSNLTFEKRTMLDCYNCKRYETEGECIECHFEPKADTPQNERRE